MLSSLILWGPLLTILLYFAYVLRNHYNYWKNLGIGCDKPSWVFGTFNQAVIRRTFFDIFTEYYNKYKDQGPFAGFFWFFRPAVLVTDLALVKQILIKDFNKFTDRGWFLNERDDPLSAHLFNLEGDQWRYMRNKLSPTFTTGKIKFMFPTIVAVAQQLVGAFNEAMEKNAKVEITDLMGRYSTHVLGTCAFGLDINSLKDPRAKFHIMSKKAVIENHLGIFGLAFRFSFPKLAARLRMRETTYAVEDFFMDVVKTTVKHREENNIKRNDFMNLLLELKNEAGTENLTIEQIAAQAFIFLVAGSDSSAATLTYALYELAVNRDIQERVRKDINRVLQQHNHELSYESLGEMKYLDQILQETLRLYSPIPVLNRVALQDHIVPDHPKFVIKKGMPIIIPVIAIHRDEKYFPNPNKFDPENFSPERIALRASLSYFPFGEGPRNCIAGRFGKMEVLVGLIMLLTNFKFALCEETPVPMQFDKKNFMLSPAGKVLLEVTKI